MTTGSSSAKPQTTSLSATSYSGRIARVAHSSFLLLQIAYTSFGLPTTTLATRELSRQQPTSFFVFGGPASARMSVGTSGLVTSVSCVRPNTSIFHLPSPPCLVCFGRLISTLSSCPGLVITDTSSTLVMRSPLIPKLEQPLLSPRRSLPTSSSRTSCVVGVASPRLSPTMVPPISLLSTSLGRDTVFDTSESLATTLEPMGLSSRSTSTSAKPS
jgi:hypothetical protein